MGMTIAFAALAAASQTQAAEPAAAAAPEPQICRRVTGSASRMGPRRICKTRAEWLATARDPQTDMDISDGMDPRAHNPQTGCTGGMGANNGPR